MNSKKNTKVRLWIYQHNLSGNCNGHFDFAELPVNSTREDVIKLASPFFYKCFNIKNLGIFTSPIKGNFCPQNVGESIPKKYKKARK